jgi:nitrate/nitrite-specific signal transduction histidine kinase
MVCPEKCHHVRMETKASRRVHQLAPMLEQLTSGQEIIDDFADRKSPRVRWLRRLWRLVAVLAFVGTLDVAVSAQQDRWAEPRAAMVRTIQVHAALLPEARAPTVYRPRSSMSWVRCRGTVRAERVEARPMRTRRSPSVMGRQSLSRSLSR